MANQIEAPFQKTKTISIEHTLKPTDLYFPNPNEILKLS